MKLYELRQLLKDYEQTGYFRKYVYGDHNEAIIVRQFLRELEHKQDYYELTALDIFTLLKIIPHDSNLTLIRSIKSLLNVNYLLDIFNILNTAGLLNQDNFALIYNLPCVNRLVLYNLFCCLPLDRINLKSEVVDTILTIASRSKFIDASIEQCFRFLSSKNYLTSIPLIFLSEKENESHAFLNLLQELDKANCLNDTCIAYAAGQPSLYLTTELLILLNHSNIKINNKLFIEICAHKNIQLLIETATILIDSECHFNTGILNKILNEDCEFLRNTNPVLMLLQKYGFLDEKMFAYVYNKNNDVSSLNQILEILSDNLLLIQSRKLVDKIVNKELDSTHLCRAITHLKKANLLDQTSLDSCVQKLLMNSDSATSNSIMIGLLESNRLENSINTIHISNNISFFPKPRNTHLANNSIQESSDYSNEHTPNSNSVRQ